jgi:hypothetical protein
LFEVAMQFQAYAHRFKIPYDNFSIGSTGREVVTTPVKSESGGMSTSYNTLGCVALRQPELILT